ncbi:hypothetical protein UFOVP693_35 [uncultured Caudovirales phage]|uniref:Uncharacterized protein n=1 Tax=uncultured Caudovirales phage TaxID=2100421 RepID=A0A6J5NJG1_9CAUD|nr:hypothetical protein UFOVP693_35 [uncultured Caudovirales phage]
MFTTPFAFMAAPAGGYDPDAQAYIDAVIAAGGTLSSPNQDAINTLFVDLKTAGVYAKTVMMYPYTGNTQNSNAIEGLNPGTNNITFNTVTGSWTFNSNGATPALQGWATNGVYLNTVLTTNNAAIFTYLGGTDNPFSGDYVIDFGTADNLGVNGLNGLIGGSSQPDQNSYFYNNDGGATRIVISSSSIPNGIGAILINRTSANLFNVWRNGTKLATDTDTNGGVLPSVNPLYMPAPPFVIDYVNKYSSRRHQFDWVGEGLNDTEATDLYTIVNDFQTALGRNVY